MRKSNRINMKRCTTTPDKIAVMTSGGDCQGMNASVRAIVRRGISAGIEINGVYEGYRGLVDGLIEVMTWEDVSGFLQIGGTRLGTARCIEFKSDKNVRKKCVLNLLNRKINRLIVIGGDGSLTGALVLANEWEQHLLELVDEGQIPQYYATRYSKLIVVGMGGSIDNDIPGSGITIGVDSALHQIVRSIDIISTTANSHQRTFIIEVMGRACGYLALVSAIACGADFVFIPENPSSEDWPNLLVDYISHQHKRFTVIVVAEGALDVMGEKISSNNIKDALAERGLDSRITILGHMQRGGNPSAYDRLISTILGVVSVRLALNNPPIPQYVGINGKKVVLSNLEDNINLCKEMDTSMKNENWARCLELRGEIFSHAFKIFNIISQPSPPIISEENTRFRVAFFCVGAPSPGMNAAIRAGVRLAMAKGHETIGFYDGLGGLASGDVCILDWDTVSKWSSAGGIFLGTNRKVPSDVGIENIAKSIQKYKIDGIIIVGGWEAYVTVDVLSTNSKKYEEFRIPIIAIPAVVSNNCPGTDFSIGCDTALNQIVGSLDIISQSDSSAHHHVYIVEVMGGKCGYLALVGSIAAGANYTYIPEYTPHLEDLLSDIEATKNRANAKQDACTLILNNEKSSDHFSTETIFELYQGESGGEYSCKRIVLGHIQQGYFPSPLDRFHANIIMSYAVDFLEERCMISSPWYGVVGLVDDAAKYSSISELKHNMNFSKRRPHDQWWVTELRPIMNFLKEKEQIDEAPQLIKKSYENAFLSSVELSFSNQ